MHAGRTRVVLMHSVGGAPLHLRALCSQPWPWVLRGPIARAWAQEVKGGGTSAWAPHAKGWRGACRTTCVPAPIREEERGGYPPVRKRDARGGGLCHAPALPCPVEAQKTPLLCINRGRIGGRRRVPRLLSGSIERGPGEKVDCVPFAHPPPPPTYLRLSWSHSPVRRQTDGGGC